jgi:hypothetical protein
MAGRESLPSARRVAPGARSVLSCSNARTDIDPPNDGISQVHNRAQRDDEEPCSLPGAGNRLCRKSCPALPCGQETGVHNSYVHVHRDRMLPRPVPGLHLAPALVLWLVQ